MKHNQHNLNNPTSSPSEWFTYTATQLTFIATIALYSAAVTAGAPAPEDAIQTASTEKSEYVDSIHTWGAWELDIEPAAGGLKPQTTQPLSTRESSLRLRTNSVAAVAPQSPGSFITAAPTTPSVVPPAPVAPTIIPIAPISPSIPPPVGGPSDGL